MRVEKARNLNGDLFAAAGRPRDDRRLGDVGRHREADTAEELDSLGDLVHELVLLLVVFVEEEMELVEGVAGHLPVVLLVHVPKRDRVGQHLVQVPRALGTDVFAQGIREPRDRPVGLNLGCALADKRPGTTGEDVATALKGVLLRHFVLLSPAESEEHATRVFP